MVYRGVWRKEKAVWRKEKEMVALGNGGTEGEETGEVTDGREGEDGDSSKQRVVDHNYDEEEPGRWRGPMVDGEGRGSSVGGKKTERWGKMPVAARISSGGHGCSGDREWRSRRGQWWCLGRRRSEAMRRGRIERREGGGKGRARRRGEGSGREIDEYGEDEGGASYGDRRSVVEAARRKNGMGAAARWGHGMGKGGPAEVASIVGNDDGEGTTERRKEREAANGTQRRRSRQRSTVKDGEKGGERWI